MTASILRSVVAIAAISWFESQALAINCSRARSRADRLICTDPGLKRQDDEMAAAFSQAIKRFGSASDELIRSQVSWLSDRDAACANPNRDTMERCLGAQYRTRLQVLATMQPRSSAVGTTNARRSAPGMPANRATDGGGNDALPPGTYLSEAVELTLQPGGTFFLQQLGGSRQASGEYETADGAITFKSGRGDVGRTVFPLRCSFLQTPSGFAVYLGQTGCRPFAGLYFKAAGGNTSRANQSSNSP